MCCVLGRLRQVGQAASTGRNNTGWVGSALYTARQQTADDVSLGEDEEDHHREQRKNADYVAVEVPEA